MTTTSPTPIPTWFKWFLTIWMVLQLGRLIAIPLIQAVMAGADHPAWMYPAVIDVVVAAATPVVLFALWRLPGSNTWQALWTYFVVSILDHGGAITATLTVGIPETFQQMFGLAEGNVWSGLMTGPGGQTLIDLICLSLLWRHRAAFGRAANA